MAWSEEQESEMEVLLSRLGVGEEIKAKFKTERVYATTVKLLGDEELEALGLRMGDRVMLRKMCAEAAKSKTVCEEVRSILSPLPFSPRFGGQRGQSSSMLERRPKRKGKSKLAEEKYRFSTIPKGRRPAPTFQKKLVVVHSMGPDSPKSFALKETYVLIRGMLPEIEINACEKEVRDCICNTIKNSEESLSHCGPDDFEFLEASGKCLCVPAHQASFAWTGRAVKQLAGTGAVYVRLTIEPMEEEEEESGSSEADSLPDVKVLKVERGGSAFWQGRYQGPRTRSVASLPHSARPQTEHSGESLPGPSSRIEDESSASPISATPQDDKLGFMAGALPGVPRVQLEFLLGVCEGDVDKATHFFVEAFSLSSLLGVLRSSILDEEDVRRIEIDGFGDREELARTALDFYKEGGSFSPKAEVRIDVTTEEVVDGGGVRRQFMSYVLATFRSSKTLRLFEGPADRVRPIFKQSSVLSGMLVAVGRIIGHSIVLDGQGFPFLSPACYFYMAGHVERALSLVGMEDACERVQQVARALQEVRGDDQLQTLPCLEEVLTLMEQSGCDRCLKVGNLQGICDDLLYYDVLQKRKVFLDALAEGLEVFRLKTAVNLFPALLEPLFVSTGKCSSEDVLKMLTFQDALVGDKERIANYLKNFIRKLSEPELKEFLICTTGSPCLYGNAVNVVFTADKDSPAFSFATCGGQITVSEAIKTEEDFSMGLKTVLSGHEFTVP